MICRAPNVCVQNPVGNNMIMPTINKVCVVYCTGDNCTSSDCVSVSGNNPFLINNIVNGTSYNISVSLRNDFGQSRQNTPELYGESKAVSVMDIHMTVYIVYVYDFYLVRL